MKSYWRRENEKSNRACHDIHHSNISCRLHTGAEQEVLKRSKLQQQLTESQKVIPAGETGNEFGKKPIFAIWYTIKNTSNKKVTPVSAASVLHAYQPAQSKKRLIAAPLPDEKLASNYKVNIEKNHSAKGSMAWNLYDTKSPIKIYGVKYGTNQTIGIRTYSIK